MNHPEQGHRLPTHRTPTTRFPGPWPDRPALAPLPNRYEPRVTDPVDLGASASKERRRIRIELAVVALLVAAPAIPLALSGPGKLTLPAVLLGTGALTVAAQVLASLGITGVVIYLLWRDKQLDRAGLPWPGAGRVIGIGLLAWLSAIAAAFIAVMLLVATTALFGGHPSTAIVHLADGDITWGFLASYIALAISAGLAEEVTFRAYAITRMHEAGWQHASWWVPLLVWTATNLYQGLFAWPSILAIGIVFVVFYAWQRNVWPLVVGHTLVNLSLFGLIVLWGP